MTQTNFPYIILRELLIITHTGSIAYRQPFHTGVNIIRGDNGSGKSTISNFIFFVLGGDFNNWTTEAALCREVLAEVEFSGKILTLRRFVTESLRQPMDIYLGTLEEAIKDTVNWQRYPYNHTDSKDSYSTIMFKALGVPEAKTEEESKITIHQILRFLYIDQDSPVQNLIRFVPFDAPLIREATGELLFGIYDETLYADRVNLRNTKKKLDEKAKDLKVIKGAFAYSGNKISLTEIEKDIEGQKIILTDLLSKIDEVKQKSFITLRSNSKTKIEKLQEEFKIVNDEMLIHYDKVQSLNYQISDSKLFVDSITKRLKAIEDSIKTRKILGNLPLAHCPQCLGELSISEVDDKNCSLCHKEVDPEEANTHAFRIKQDLDNQIKESNYLLDSKSRLYQEHLMKYNQLLEQTKKIKQNLNLETKTNSSVRDDQLDDLYTAKGTLERNIELLEDQKQNAFLVQNLIKEISLLESEISALTSNIAIKTINQQTTYAKVVQKVGQYARPILEQDGGYQEEFSNPHSVEFNVRDDVFSLDGKFNFSASSNIYLKNTIRFSIALASNDIKEMRYPRFILCDNIEDKGMQPVRSQQFQKSIVALSKAADVTHQIILTTSMVDPALSSDESLCVGEFYTKGNRTLKNIRNTNRIELNNL